MIHVNDVPALYEWKIPFSYSGAGTNPFYVADASGATLQFTWGQNYSFEVSGFQANLTNKFPDSSTSHQYNANFICPFYPYEGNAGPFTGTLASGYIRVQMVDGQELVDSSCNWELNLASLTAWVNFGAGESVLFTCGAQSITGTDYDERLNNTFMSGYNTVTNTIAPGLICGTAPGTWQNGVGWGPGGYRYSYDGGVTWHYDPILLDDSATPGVCSCQLGLPMLTGTNSFNVAGGAVTSYSIVQGSTTGPVPCPPAIIDYYWWNLYSYFTITSEDVVIKDKRVSVNGQIFSNNWYCNTSPGGTTSGGITVPSLPPFTTCASSRSVVTNVQTELGCFTPHTVPVGWAPCWPTGLVTCDFRASAGIVWPNLPPCTPRVTYGVDLTHDKFGIVYRCANNGASIILTRYNFVDINDSFVVFTGTCENASIACGPTNLLLIVFDDGTTTYGITSTNAGQTWSEPVSITAGTWPEPAIDDRDGTEYVAISDGTNFNCWRLKNGEAAFSNVGTIVTAAPGKAGLTIQSSVNHWLIFEISISGTVYRYVSTNAGVSWALT